ncbi:MAG TPA: hypothetical protein VJ870_12720 [Amycolatopsis sp.]|nr:hypothetical protein [Amycolatopsis sp.]
MAEVVFAARRDPGGVTVTSADGGEVRARRLLVTTGLTDVLPQAAAFPAADGG